MRYVGLISNSKPSQRLSALANCKQSSCRQVITTCFAAEKSIKACWKHDSEASWDTNRRTVLLNLLTSVVFIASPKQLLAEGIA